jgi:hypothetical protein
LGEEESLREVKRKGKKRKEEDGKKRKHTVPNTLTGHIQQTLFSVSIRLQR